METPKTTYALLSSLDPITEVAASGYQRTDATGKEPPFTLEIDGFNSKVVGFVVFNGFWPVRVTRLPCEHNVRVGDKLLLHIGEP